MGQDPEHAGGMNTHQASWYLRYSTRVWTDRHVTASHSLHQLAEGVALKLHPTPGCSAERDMELLWYPGCCSIVMIFFVVFDCVFSWLLLVLDNITWIQNKGRLIFGDRPITGTMIDRKRVLNCTTLAGMVAEDSFTLVTSCGNTSVGTLTWCHHAFCLERDGSNMLSHSHMQPACPKVGGVRQDNVYDVDVKVVLLPNLLDVDIFMALSLDMPWLFLGRLPTQTPSCHVLSIHVLTSIFICYYDMYIYIYIHIYIYIYIHMYD